jgi:hypothetical protein
VALDGKSMVMIRMQVSNIISPLDETNLGAVIYGNSYFWIDKDLNISITENVPNV